MMIACKLQVFAVVRNPPWRAGRSASGGEGIPARTVHFQVSYAQRLPNRTRERTAPFVVF